MELLDGESLRERSASGRCSSPRRSRSSTRSRGARKPRTKRHRPPRPQARQRVHAARRAKADVKLLDFGLAKLTDANERAVPPNAHGHGDGHAALHVAGAGEGREGRRRDRRLLARRDVVRDARRRRAVQGRQRSRDHGDAHLGARGAPDRAPPWVPPEVNGLVLAMLEKDASNRPTTTQVREQLAAIRASAGAQTMMTPPGGMGAPAWTPQSPAMTPQGPR